MDNSNVDYDFQSYMNQLKFELNTAIYSVTNVSNKGNLLGSKIQDLYDTIEKLNGKLDENKYNEIVDIANMKSDELNASLAILTKGIPSDIEYSAKMEAKENNIDIPNVKYFKLKKINHIHSNKSNINNFEEAQTIVNKINQKYDEVMSLTYSLNEIATNYALSQYKVSNVANQISNTSKSLMNAINQRCNF